MSDRERPIAGDPARDIDEVELSAYLDGELDGEARRRVAAALESSEIASRRLGRFSRVDQTVARYADALASSAPPARLCVRRMAAERRARGGRRLALMAAAMLLLCVGVASGWLGHGLFHWQTFVARSFVEDAASAHHVFSVEVRHPVEVARADQGHLVAWLSKRLAHPVSAPNLEANGFMLVGGRLLPTRQGAPAAQLMYEDADGRRITLYAARNAGGKEAAFRYFQTKYSGAETIYWFESDVGFALTGGVDRETLLMLAHAILKGMEGA